MNTMYGPPAGPAALPDPYPQSPSTPNRRKRVLRWSIGVTLAGFLAGGTIALALTSGSNPVATVSTANQTQGATLNSVLNTASSTSPAVPLPRMRWALARLRTLGGVYGQFTYHNSTGYHTVAFERGTIQSVNGNDVVVRAPDGTTWTWLIVSDTVIRQSGGKTTTKALAAGQAVFTGGPVVNGSKDARLIVIRPGSSRSSSSSSVSGPAGTSVS